MERADVRLPLRVLADSQSWRLAKWLVKPGSPVYLKQRVAVLKSRSTGAIDHALAPHSGVLINTSVSDGDVVDASSAPIAQIEYCPHSVVFKGVCAVCGQDADTPHFAVTPSSEESRLPVAYNSTFLSVTRAEAESVSSATARRLFESNRLSLVLDLDHTLVHATDDPRAAAVLTHSPHDADFSSVSSFTLCGPNSATSAVMHIKLRPNLVQFLTRVAPKFELHIYTMGSRPYADRVAHLIDPDKTFFSGRITSREDFAEGLFNRKSIQRLFPCDDSMVLIVDDREDVWISGTNLKFMPNLIAADPYSFWGGLHEAYDRSSKPKQTVKSHVSADLQPADLPVSVVPHVNGNEGPMKEAHAPTASKQEAANKDDKTRMTPPLQRPLSNEVPKEDNRSLERLSQEHDEERASSNEKQSEVLTDVVERRPQRSVGRIIGNGGTQSGTNEKSSFISDEEARVAAEELAERLRQVVKGWWDSDMSPKASNHLLRLAQVLEDCHNDFFCRSKLAIGGPEPLKTDSNQNVGNFQAPIDIKNILAERRQKVLTGCVLTFTGVIPTGTKPDAIPLWNLALRLGAVCSMDFVNGRTTHVVASQSRPTNTQKCKEAMHFGTAFVVFVNWLEDSALNFERQHEFEYCEERTRAQHKNAAELRRATEEKFRLAACAFKKRSKSELDEISAREIYLHNKRAKFETRQSSNGSLDVPCTDRELREVRVLTGDEIGAAIDAAFEE